MDSREKRSTVLCLLLVLVTLAFYNRIIHNGFTNLDDNAYIVENVHVRAGLTWSTVKWAFTTGEGGNWHPLTWLSHALDYELFKQNPAGHHYVSVLIHAGNAILLFLLLQTVTGLTWPSFMVAGLFALHPMNVESVAWASERKNVLSMFTFLLALHAYGWYVWRENVRRYSAVFALFALGLMAKPEIITLPFVLLLWDYWPLRRMFGSKIDHNRLAARSFRFLCLEKVPLLLLSAASAVVTLLTQRASSAVRDASNRVRFGNAVVAYVRYIGKAFWPSRLAALYPHPGRLLPTWEIVASAALLIAVTALVLRWRDRRYLPAGWFWFLGTMVPVIGLVQVGVQAMADRYAYLSFIGLFICVVWGATELAQARKIPAGWLAAPAAVILLTLGMLTRQQIPYWHDSESLWRHTLSVTERNYFAHNLLAYALEDQGRTEEAISEFNASEALHDYSPSALVAVGIFEQTHGHVPEAIAQYQKSLEISTDSKSRAEAMGHLGSAYIQTGDAALARTSYVYALQQDPDNAVALVGNALLAERDGDFGSAAVQISRAMQVSPTGVGYVLLAQALRRDGRLAEAREALTRAQQLSPDLLQAEQSAARVLITVGIKPE